MAPNLANPRKIKGTSGLLHPPRHIRAASAKCKRGFCILGGHLPGASRAIIASAAYHDDGTIRALRDMDLSPRQLHGVRRKAFVPRLASGREVLIPLQLRKCRQGSLSEYAGGSRIFKRAAWRTQGVAALVLAVSRLFRATPVRSGSHATDLSLAVASPVSPTNTKKKCKTGNQCLDREWSATGHRMTQS